MCDSDKTPIYKGLSQVMMLCSLLILLKCDCIYIYTCTYVYSYLSDIAHLSLLFGTRDARLIISRWIGVTEHKRAT